MNKEAADIIAAFGGVRKTARLTKTSPGTVWAWKDRGMPASRMDHLRLLADEHGVSWPEATEKERVA